MKAQEEILEQIRKIKPYLKDQYGVKEIGVFGSYARNEQTDKSDIDILVEIDKEIDLLDFIHMQNEIADRLETKVDLVLKRALKQTIAKRVLNEVIILE